MTILSLRGQSRGLGLSPRRRAAKGVALPSIVQDGLVAEWRFDQGAGQVLDDATGNGHHGRLGSTTGADAADPTWTAQGLSFDGGDLVLCDNIGISGGAARTVMAVVKASPPPTSRFGFEWGGTSTNGTRWTLHKDTSSGNLELDIRGATFEPALLVPADTWCFVAATQSGNNLNTVTLYLNGSSAASSTSATIDTSTHAFVWGQDSAILRVMQAAYGLVYNRALSAAEVEQNRQVLKSLLAARGITLP